MFVGFFLRHNIYLLLFSTFCNIKSYKKYVHLETVNFGFIWKCSMVLKGRFIIKLIVEEII